MTGSGSIVKCLLEALLDSDDSDKKTRNMDDFGLDKLNKFKNPFNTDGAGGAGTQPVSAMTKKQFNKWVEDKKTDLENFNTIAEVHDLKKTIDLSIEELSTKLAPESNGLDQNPFADTILRLKQLTTLMNEVSEKIITIGERSELPVVVSAPILINKEEVEKAAKEAEKEAEKAAKEKEEKTMENSGINNLDIKKWAYNSTINYGSYMLVDAYRKTSEAMDAHEATLPKSSETFNTLKLSHKDSEVIAMTLHSSIISQGTQYAEVASSHVDDIMKVRKNIKKEDTKKEDAMADDTQKADPKVDLD